MGKSKNKSKAKKAPQPSSDGGIITGHKKSLDKLKDQDPEFYEFLKNEDKKLLQFNDSGSDVDDDDDDDDQNGGSDEEATAGNDADVDDMDDPDLMSESDSDEDEGMHRFPDKLEVASDSGEEDSEAEEEGPSKKKAKQQTITMKMVKQWAKALKETASLSSIKQAVMAFKAVVNSSGENAEASPYKIDGSSVFNAIVRLCISQLVPAFVKFLNLPKPKASGKAPTPASSPKWKKIKIDVKTYLTDVIKLTSDLSNASVLDVILRHVSQLVDYYACFPKIIKVLLKRMIVIWSSGEETSRVLSFLTINRLVRANQQNLLEMCIKQMYMAYVQNCKFTSPTTLPLINFMQRSLVEMFVLDFDLTYQYAFIYIRQLAIHLRSAITVKKPETCQAVYNWQYVHSLHLWARLVGETHPNPVLEPLIYPLTQTIIGAIKLQPVEKYYPLRFHCVKALNMISASTDTYIPVLPLLTEILEMTDYNKKHKSISFKPINFLCILKLSKAQLSEKAFRDGVIDQLYEHLIDQFHIHAHTIGFPELALPALVVIKQFLKKCKIANYTKQIKQIVEKVEETSKVIMQRRKTVSLSLNDHTSVNAWENRSKQEGTPLSKYYASWRKLRDREIQFEIAGKERISSENLPTIERPKKGPKKASEEEREEFADLFDVSDDEDDEIRFLPKEERPKKKQKIEEPDTDESDYSDFDEKDLAVLAGPGGESDDEGDDDDNEDDEEDDDDESGDAEEDEDEDDDDDAEDIVEDLTFSSDED